MQSKSSDDHLQDLALVKEILQRQEDRVILPPWAWYFWALVVALGTAVSVVAVGEWGWTHPQVALRIWPVVILVGSVSETAGWVRFFREGYPLTGALAAAAFVTGGVHTAIASRRYG